MTEQPIWKWAGYKYRDYIIRLGKTDGEPYDICLFADNHGVNNISFFEEKYGHSYNPQCYTYDYGGSESMRSWNEEDAILLGEVMIDNIIKNKELEKVNVRDIIAISSWLKK